MIGRFEAFKMSGTVARFGYALKHTVKGRAGWEKTRLRQFKKLPQFELHYKVSLERGIQKRAHDNSSKFGSSSGTK